MTTKIATLLLTVLVAACGGDQDDQKNPKANAPDGSANGWGVGVGSPAAALDEEILGEEVGAQVDDAVTALADDAEQDDGGMSLSELALEIEAKRWRDCQEDGGKAVIAMRRGIELSREFELKYRRGTASFRNVFEKTRTWAKADAWLACAENGKQVALTLEEMQGVTLDVSFRHERSRSLHVENTKTGKVQDRATTKLVSGTHHAQWGQVSTEGGFITLEKTVSLEAERKLTAQGKDGQSKEVVRTVKTDAAAPLAITVKRDSQSGEIVERRIKSGKLVATGKDGGRLETVFTEVVYVRDAGCVAASGKIEGSIYAPGATEITLGFVVNLGEGKITYTDGREVDYASQGCDLDEPTELTEAATKDEVPAAR